jgi:prolyl-tRNA synthetase
MKGMRQSMLMSTTLREAPGDADAVSHKLLLRAGYIRQLAAGVYTYMPLGLRVLRNIERIIREELDRAGAQEILMPILQPVELWKESGRYSAYGPELMRIADRHNREFALGPTHEEVITRLVDQELHSYRRLPVTLYQVQTKFRDERRPRFGLLRGREFVMKDAYSFDMDEAGLAVSYERMYAAYNRIFERCGLTFRPVEADSGTIGGSGGTHEFMALADIGEDTIVACTHCGYAANLEKAESGAVSGECNRMEGGEMSWGAEAGKNIGCSNDDRNSGEDSTNNTNRTNSKKVLLQGIDAPAMERVHTPGARTINDLVQLLGVEANELIKTMVCLADGKAVAVLIRGDHELNEVKLKQALQAEELVLPDPETTARLSGAPVGYMGPVGLSLPLYVDVAVAAMSSGVTGANETDYHLRHVRPGRDFPLDHSGDYRNAVQGEACPRCKEGTYGFHRGIEIGQVFKLGTKYSAAMNATYLDAAGREQPLVMGCYGVGVSRVLAAVAEQHHDAAGLAWPAALAPYSVHLLQLSAADEAQSALAEELYSQLQSQGIGVLFDDREERAGVKFKDADLLGMPHRIVIGRQAAEGLVEYRERQSQEMRVMEREEVLQLLTN